MSNARSTTRRRVLKGAVAAFNGKFSTIPCTVRDLSDTGCRLAAEAWTSIPDTFELSIDLDGLSASCAVVWRRDGEVGVKFASPPTRGQPSRQQIVSAVVPADGSRLRRKPIAKP